VPGTFTIAATQFFNIDSSAFEGNYSMIFCQTFTILYFYSNFIYHAMFFAIVLEICLRYKKINEILENEEVWYVQRNKIQIFPKVNSIRYLKEISQLYLHVNNTTTLVNQIFSLPIMIAIGFYISTGVLSLYELFSIFSIPNVTIQQIGFCIIVNAWLPNSLIGIILEVTFCMLTVKEGKRTNIILRNFQCNESDEKIKKRLKVFQQQIFHSRPSFSCGLFEFQWSFLGTVR